MKPSRTLAIIGIVLAAFVVAATVAQADELPFCGSWPPPPGAQPCRYWGDPPQKPRTTEYSFTITATDSTGAILWTRPAVIIMEEPRTPDGSPLPSVSFRAEQVVVRRTLVPKGEECNPAAPVIFEYGFFSNAVSCLP